VFFREGDTMTNAHDAKAREIVKKSFYSLGDTEPHGISKDGEQWLTEAIAIALRACEREAYERAAKLVQGYFEEYDIRSVTEELPSRIRALAQQEPK
jgi:hypothetical protein